MSGTCCEEQVVSSGGRDATMRVHYKNTTEPRSRLAGGCIMCDYERGGGGGGVFEYANEEIPSCAHLHTCSESASEEGGGGFYIVDVFEFNSVSTNGLPYFSPSLPI